MSGKEDPKKVLKPSNRIEGLQNIVAAVNCAKDDGINALASAEDISKGDRKSILSFMYQILDKYRFGCL